MDPIKSFLEITKLARKQVYKNLTVFPLLAPDGVKPDYLILEQALDQQNFNCTSSTQITRLLEEANFERLRIQGSAYKGLF